MHGTTASPAFPGLREWKGGVVIYEKKLAGVEPRRRAAGMTQQQLAAELQVSRQTLSSWETGESWPSASWLPAIADALLCSIDDLYDAPTDGMEAPE